MQGVDKYMSNPEKYLNDYPFPFFVIKPILENGKCKDFSYVYVNNAFRLFLGLNRIEMIDSKFSDFFDASKAEAKWLNVFKEAAIDKKYQVINDDSMIIGKKLILEAYHIDPNLCGCIIRDYTESDDVVFGNLVNKAYKDNLTGLYNRFSLQEYIKTLNEKDGLGVAVLDINHLKYINDTYGHKRGDDLIIKFSNILLKHFDLHFLYRVGGDEFVILVEGFTKVKFIEKCHELINDLDNIAAIGFKYYDKLEGFNEAFQECDSLMYDNKLESRDKWNIHL